MEEEQQPFDPEAQAPSAEDRRLEENLEIEKFLYYPDMVDYNSFKNLAFTLIGDKKEYESGIELASAYKILKSIIKKPLDIFIDGKKEPHYMKPTISIKRYKFEGEIRLLFYKKKYYNNFNKILFSEESFDRTKSKLDSSRAGAQSKTKDLDMKNVERILEDLDKRMKRDLKV